MAGHRARAQFDLDDKAFRAALKQAVKRMDLLSAEDLERLGYSVVNRARTYAPVDTGRLRNSIDIQEKGRDTSGPFVDVGTRVDYAGFVEYGTRHMAAQPYLRPALLEAVTHWKPRITP